jgi:hypothetical protein
MPTMPRATTPRSPTLRRARVVCAVVAVTGVVCAALATAAVLAPAPAVVVPVLVLVCIGLPMAATYDLPTAIHVLRNERAERLKRRDLRNLRRELADLPETRHPLDR